MDLRWAIFSLGLKSPNSLLTSFSDILGGEGNHKWESWEPHVLGCSLCDNLHIQNRYYHTNRSLHRQYYWYDERGKKIKCTAPQYVDFVMSSVQKLVTDEDVFPTKYGMFILRKKPNSVRSLWLWHIKSLYWSTYVSYSSFIGVWSNLN